MKDLTQKTIKSILEMDITINVQDRNAILEFCKNPTPANSTPPPPDRLLSIAKVAERWTYTQRTIWRYMDSGQLQYQMVGGRRKISETEVNRFENLGKKPTGQISTNAPEKIDENAG